MLVQSRAQAQVPVPTVALAPAPHARVQLLHQVREQVPAGDQVLRQRLEPGQALELAPEEALAQGLQRQRRAPPLQESWQRGQLGCLLLVHFPAHGNCPFYARSIFHRPDQPACQPQSPHVGAGWR